MTQAYENSDQKTNLNKVIYSFVSSSGIWADSIPIKTYSNLFYIDMDNPEEQKYRNIEQSVKLGLGNWEYVFGSTWIC